jgi:hypothetical protein
MVLMIFLGSCNRNLRSLLTKKETLEVVDPQFDYLSAKAKFRFEHDNNKIAASANFRIKKDSIIWLSISPALGIELARVLINSTNIYVIDRLNKCYYEYSFNELSKNYGFEFDFDMVQSVLLGNSITPYENQDIEKTNDFFAYVAARNGYNFHNYVGTRTMKLERLDVSDSSTKNTISVSYADFDFVDSQIFPNNIVAIVNYETGKPDTRIDILYNKLVIEDSPINFPFTVSNKYERK